jgi:hypothetical protein
MIDQGIVEIEENSRHPFDHERFLAPIGLMRQPARA